MEKDTCNEKLVMVKTRINKEARADEIAIEMLIVLDDVVIDEVTEVLNEYTIVVKYRKFTALPMEPGVKPMCLSSNNQLDESHHKSIYFGF